MRIISSSTFEFICVDHPNLDKGPDLKVVCSKHIETPLEKQSFPLRVFVNWRQPLLSGWESFLLSHFGTGTQLVWIFAGHMHDATSQCVQKSVLFCVEHSVSLLSPIPIGSYNFFTSFSAQFPENGGEEIEEDISLSMESLNVFHLCKLSSCGSLHEFSLTSGESFLVMAK